MRPTTLITLVYDGFARRSIVADPDRLLLYRRSGDPPTTIAARLHFARHAGPRPAKPLQRPRSRLVCDAFVEIDAHA